MKVQRVHKLFCTALWITESSEGSATSVNSVSKIRYHCIHFYLTDQVEIHMHLYLIADLMILSNLHVSYRSYTCILWSKRVQILSGKVIAILFNNI